MRMQKEFACIVCVGCDHVYSSNEEFTFLNEDPKNRTGCSKCRSKLLIMKKLVLEKPIPVYTILKYEFKNPNSGKTHVEGKTGDEYYTETGEWQQLERRFDHLNDTYDEVIRNTNGDVVVKKHELLSNHKGRGSDKRKISGFKTGH